MDRLNLDIKSTHKGYRPTRDGKLIDVDAQMNTELEKLKDEYWDRTIRESIHNVKNFFRILAVKYNLELDFSIE